MALGIGLTITNTKAVLEALFGIKTAFARTPKYRVIKKGEKSQAKKYRKRLGIVPWIELAIGSYFARTVWYAVSTENYFTVPFLVLFVFGYWYTGLLSLLQGRFERRSPAATRCTKSPIPSESKPNQKARRSGPFPFRLPTVRTGYRTSRVGTKSAGCFAGRSWDCPRSEE